MEINMGPKTEEVLTQLDTTQYDLGYDLANRIYVSLRVVKNICDGTQVENPEIYSSIEMFKKIALSIDPNTSFCDIVDQKYVPLGKTANKILGAVLDDKSITLQDALDIDYAILHSYPSVYEEA